MTLRTPGVCCPWRTHDDAPDMPMSRRRAGSCARQQHADPAVRRATSWALRCTDASCWPDLAQHECAVVRRRSGCCSSNPAVPNWSRLTTRTRDRRTDTRGTPTHWLRRARIGYFIDVHVSAAEGGGRRASSARGGLRPSRSTCCPRFVLGTRGVMTRAGGRLPVQQQAALPANGAARTNSGIEARRAQDTSRPISAGRTSRVR